MHFAYFQPPLLYVLSLSLHLSYGSPVTLMGFKSRHSHSHRGSEALPAVTQTYTHAHIYRTRTKITCWDRYKLKTPHTESQTDWNGHQHTPSPHYTAFKKSTSCFYFGCQVATQHSTKTVYQTNIEHIVKHTLVSTNQHLLQIDPDIIYCGMSFKLFMLKSV